MRVKELMIDARFWFDEECINIRIASVPRSVDIFSHLQHQERSTLRCPFSHSLR